MRLIVDLTLPTDARLISQTRRMFSGYLAELGVDGDDASDVVLALSEACNNVMHHAYAAVPGPAASIHLSAELRPEEVVVVVEDDGVGLRPGAADATGDAMASTGRGLDLIRRLMTHVDVESAPQRSGTRVEMRKSLRAAGFDPPP